MIDYGSSTGGNISKFILGYQSNASSTVYVTFYTYTTRWDPGYYEKQYTLTLPSTNGYFKTYTYVIPEANRFQLISGNFGYSIEYTSSQFWIALASGGLATDRYVWIYDDFYDDFVLADIGIQRNFYLKLYTGPTLDEVTCDISGYKFNDLNGNTVKDGGEPYLPGWEFYLDTNNDAIHQVSEPNVVTDPNGFYIFKNMASPATYRVREIVKDGWTQTLPGSSGGYQYLVNSEPNHVYGPYNFGNTDAVIKYGGGNGTSGNPYQILTPAHMNEIGLNTGDWNKYFRLDADLDMSGYTGTQYNRIGNSTTKFTGSFNGNNHVIVNLSYSTTAATSYVGLFGYTNSATISNLGLMNVNLSSAGNYVGGLAGYVNAGTVSNCYVTGQVSGANSSQYVGGLAGFLNGTTVTNCRSVTVVHSGTNSVYVGGFAGRTGNLTNCYSAGAVNSGTGSTAVGGLVGSGGTMTSCYWDTQTSGIATGTLGNPRTTAQMYTPSNYTGWNFTTIWRICGGTNYPRLQWEPLPVGDFVCPEGVEPADVCFMGDSWLMTGALEADIAPATPDGKVDLLDFAEMATNWMVGMD
jgi:hypothetical protein